MTITITTVTINVTIAIIYLLILIHHWAIRLTMVYYSHTSGRNN